MVLTANFAEATSSFVPQHGTSADAKALADVSADVPAAGYQFYLSPCLRVPLHLTFWQRVSPAPSYSFSEIAWGYST